MSELQIFHSSGLVDPFNDAGDRRFWTVKVADPTPHVDHYRGCTLCLHHRRAAKDIRLCLHPDLQAPGKALTIQEARSPEGGCGTEAGRGAGPWRL